MRNAMKHSSSYIVVLGVMVLGLWLSTMQGCAVFRATGRSIEAVGEGAGHAVAETGEAVSDAAQETKRDLRR